MGCAVSLTDAAVPQVAGEPALIPEDALQDPHNVLASPQPCLPLTQACVGQQPRRFFRLRKVVSKRSGTRVGCGREKKKQEAAAGHAQAQRDAEAKAKQSQREKDRMARDAKIAAEQVRPGALF